MERFRSPLENIAPSLSSSMSPSISSLCQPQAEPLAETSLLPERPKSPLHDSNDGENTRDIATKRVSRILIVDDNVINRR